MASYNGSKKVGYDKVLKVLQAAKGGDGGLATLA